MTTRNKKLDLNQLAARIVGEATGEIEPVEPTPAENPQAAIEKKRLDGLKGGKARAENLTADQRREIAKLAASTRWHKVN